MNDIQNIEKKKYPNFIFSTLKIVTSKIFIRDFESIIIGNVAKNSW